MVAFKGLFFLFLGKIVSYTKNRFSLFSFLSALTYILITSTAYASIEKEVTIPYGGHISEEMAQNIARSAAWEELIQEIKSKNTVSRLMLLAELNHSDASALIALAIQVKFEDTLSLQSQNSVYPHQEGTYTAKAVLENENDMLTVMQALLPIKLKQERYAPLYKLHAEYTEEASKLTQLCATFRTNMGSHADEVYYTRLLYFSNYLDALQVLMNELKFYNGLWEEPELRREILEKAFEKAPDLPMLRLALAEILLQLDRPQASLAYLNNISQEESNIFVLRVRILSQLRMGQLALAEEDIEKAFTKIKNDDALYSHFLILKGLIAQLKKEDTLMCESYKEACLYDNCEAYYSVQEKCLKLELQ